MQPSRLFLGWQKPALFGVADYLIGRAERSSYIDLSGLRVVLPVSRAIRRLTEILVERAAASGAAVVPPLFLTAGSLAELVAESSLPLASDTERLLAWMRALEDLPGEELEKIMKQLPRAGDLAGQLALARKIDSIWSEVTAADLDFEAVCERATGIEGFIDEERWSVLAILQEVYLAVLSDAGREDPYLFRRHAAATSGSLGGELVIACCADLNPLVKKLVQGLSSPVTVLVHASESESAAFDGLGCVVPRAWSASALEIPETSLEIADKPVDQALAGIRAAERLSARFGAERITIASCVPELANLLEISLAALGIEAIDASGMPAEKLAPFRLSRSLLRYLEGRRFADLGTLARHPDLEAWLSRELKVGQGELIARLDLLQARHLPSRFDEGSPAARCPLLSRAIAALDDLLGDFSRARRSLYSWAETLARVLDRIYAAAELDGAERARLHAFGKAFKALVEDLRLTGAGLDRELGGSEALAFILERMKSERLSPERSEDSTEILGWLELPLDDADGVVLVGFNERSVPESVNSDPFLPNSLRAGLGLMDNDRRFARDAYYLESLMRSRKAAHLVAGRIDSAGASLKPSRLMFRCPSRQVASRVMRFYRDPASKCVLAAPELAGAGGRFTLFPPAPGAPIPEALSVTAFGAYLACPYRFFLEHVLKLETAHDLAREMDAPLFGELLHKALRDFGKESGVHSKPAREIYRYLSAALDRHVASEFGTKALPAVPLQVEQARARLESFAAAQAEHFANGWRIEQTEFSVPTESSALIVDGDPMPIRGRLDRLDRHSESGDWMVIDYKSGDKAIEPERAHRRGSAWVGLQLPLYRTLLRQAGFGGEIKLAYFLLTADPAECRLHVADWSSAELEEASQVAEGVVRDVRAGKFWPPGDPLFESDDLAALCGTGQLGAYLASGEDE